MWFILYKTLFILLTITVQDDKNGLLPDEAQTAAGTRKRIDFTCPSPSLKQPGCEEATECLDIRQLMQQSQQDGRDIVFGGTYYGLVTMATTVRMPLQLFEQKLPSYNRYAILANLGTDDPMLTDNHIQDLPYSTIQTMQIRRLQYQILLPGHSTGN
jgi:hypothetical protein